MKARHPSHAMQQVLSIAERKFEYDNHFDALRKAKEWYSDLLGQIEWFATKAKVTETDGMYDVKNEKGYVIATFPDKQPAKRFADLINLVGGVD